MTQQKIIPKRIHYCWFGGNTVPAHLQKCMDTWKRVMPNYEIVCWNESNFDVDQIPFTKEAFCAKKWAFVSDYARLHVLHREGGIYLDTDIIVSKPFDNFLEDGFFSAIQLYPRIVEQSRTYEQLNDDGSVKDLRILHQGVPGIGINAAVIGARPGHPLIQDCMEYYHDKHFILQSGEYNMKVNPAIYAEIAYKYGFRYKNSLQKLEDMIFYPAEIFACTRRQFSKKSYAFHFCENSWNTKSLFQKIKNKILRTNPFMWLYLKNF